MKLMVSGCSVMVKGVGQDSPKGFSFKQSLTTAPTADSTDGDLYAEHICRATEW